MDFHIQGLFHLVLQNTEYLPSTEVTPAVTPKITLIVSCAYSSSLSRPDLSMILWTPRHVNTTVVAVVVTWGETYLVVTSRGRCLLLLLLLGRHGRSMLLVMWRERSKTRPSRGNQKLLLLLLLLQRDWHDVWCACLLSFCDMMKPLSSTAVIWQNTCVTVIKRVTSKLSRCHVSGKLCGGVGRASCSLVQRRLLPLVLQITAAESGQTPKPQHQYHKPRSHQH